MGRADSNEQLERRSFTFSGKGPRREDSEEEPGWESNEAPRSPTSSLLQRWPGVSSGRHPPSTKAGARQQPGIAVPSPLHLRQSGLGCEQRAQTDNAKVQAARRSFLRRSATMSLTTVFSRGSHLRASASSLAEYGLDAATSPQGETPQGGTPQGGTPPGSPYGSRRDLSASFRDSSNVTTGSLLDSGDAEDGDGS